MRAKFAEFRPLFSPTSFLWMTRNFADIFAKFRVYVSEISVSRNFAGAKIHACQISRKRNLADTIYDAKRVNLMRTPKPA